MDQPHKEKNILGQKIDLEETTVAELIRKMHRDLKIFKEEILGVKNILTDFTKHLSKIDSHVSYNDEQIQSLEKRTLRLEKEFKYMDQRLDDFEKIIEANRAVEDYRKDLKRDESTRRTSFIANMIAVASIIIAVLTWLISTFVFK